MTVSDASPGSPANGAPPSDRAFDYPGYRLYWVARFLLVFAIQVLSVSVGWQIYDQTRDPFLLGLVGLVQFLPAPILVLVTGSVADRFNRRMIMATCMAVEAVCALALLTILHQGLSAIWPVYAVLLVFGIARAFMGPAVQSLISKSGPANSPCQRHRTQLFELSGRDHRRPRRWRTALRRLVGTRVFGLDPVLSQCPAC